MHGVCTSCSKPTSTLNTTRCKNCYTKELKEKYQREKTDRDKEIIELILSGKKAAQVAKIKGLSREAVRLILIRNNINYSALKNEAEIKKNKENEKIDFEKRSRMCSLCGKTFQLKEDGARVKYCSNKCYRKKLLSNQRERIKAYYHTQKGKEALQKYVNQVKNKNEEVEIRTQNLSSQ